MTSSPPCDAPPSP